jgi:uncharacterized membrane protein required for colicin V production
MTIWLMVVILIASVAALGFRQGAIRVAFSFVGIIVGALLAVQLGGLVAKLLSLFGLKDPATLWAVGPLVIFVIISMIFKAFAAVAHQKVDVHYKYKAGDLRLVLWERLNHRLGACVGVLNGAAYAILFAFAIYFPSYATYQLATSDQDPRWMKVLNSLGHDLQTTGFNKVARAIDRTPKLDYDMADFGGLVYHNPLIQARLSSYPGLLSLSERPDFQELGDNEFKEAWAKNVPIMELLSNGKAAGIRNNPETLKTLWTTIAPDLSDMENYFRTGRSKYDAEKVLGRWQFDVSAAINAYRRANPAIPSSKMLERKRWLTATFNKTSLVVRPDNKANIKNLPNLKGGQPGGGAQSVEGDWKAQDAKYLFSFSGTDMPASVEGDRLTLKADGMDLVFTRED